MHIFWGIRRARKRKPSLPLSYDAKRTRTRVHILREISKFLSYALVGAIFIRYTLFRGGNVDEKPTVNFENLRTVPLRRSAGEYLIDLQRGEDRIVYPAGMEWTNATLDFQQILAITSAKHPEIRSQLQKVAGFSGLDLEYVNQIVPGTLELDETPYKIHELLSGDEVAWARTHVNIWRKIVHEGWTTVLVVEADIDWEVDIRKQLPLVHEGMRVLMDVDRPLAFPQSWDILILGATYDEAQTVVEGSTVIELTNDMSTLPYTLAPWAETCVKAYYGNSKPRRLLQKTTRSGRSLAYAVSQNGARRLLSYLAQGHQKILEVELSDLIHSGDLSSYTVLPPLFVSPQDNTQLKSSARAVSDHL
jgi:hypothetical protein